MPNSSFRPTLFCATLVMGIAAPLIAASDTTPTKVSAEVTDSVTQTNTRIIATAPSTATGDLYQNAPRQMSQDPSLEQARPSPHPAIVSYAAYPTSAAISQFVIPQGYLNPAE